MVEIRDVVRHDEWLPASTSITVDERTGPNNALPDGPLYVGMDGGYVRGREQAWFEAIASKSLVSFHRDGPDPGPSGRCFAFVQTVDDKPRARLVDTLRQQGMQPQQQVVFLSDGADTLRRLQQNIAPKSEHVLDWFHVTMRLTVLGQMIKGREPAPSRSRLTKSARMPGDGRSWRYETATIPPTTTTGSPPRSSATLSGFTTCSASACGM